MATIGNTYVSLADLRKQSNANDEIADIIEMMAQQNTMLMDAPVIECNEGNAHLTTVRAGLPTPTWRKLYQGVQPTKGITAQVRDTTGYMEDWSEIDAKLVEKAQNPAKFRMNGAKAHLMGIANTYASTLIYGDTATNPERFTGLAPRFSSTSAPNGNQIILGDAAASGADSTSIWFVVWGEETVHLLYPEGSAMGVQREDLGKETKENNDGSLYRVYRERFGLDCGLSVRDWRGVSCVRNIDMSTITASGTTGTDLIDKMIDAFYALDNPGMQDRQAICYCSRNVAKFLHKQAANRSNMYLTQGEFAGMKVTEFLGIPIRRMDAILETESPIS